uniref:Mob1/phocein n=1 Tax=Entomoneis paludosa TaxID=265537 RepID=A0A7S2Y1J3_9STRA
MPPGSHQGTFQPLLHRSGTLRERLHSYTKRTLGAGGSINEAVALPPGESCAAWVAVHAIDFYNDVSTIWAVMSTDPYLASFRPGEGFPSGVEYRWSDDTQQQAVSVSAPVYIDKVLQWIAQQMNDETKFPNSDASSEDEQVALRVFQTPQFAALCGQVFRRLFRVYGIIYSSFFGTLEALEMAPHLNSCFKHFMYFCTEFGLLPEREIEPLEVLVRPIRKQYYNAKQGITSSSTTTSNANSANSSTTGSAGSGGK